MTSEGEKEDSTAVSSGIQVDGKPHRQEENLGIPENTEHAHRLGSVVGKGSAFPVLDGFPDAEAGSYRKSHYHGPTGCSEERVALENGHPQETRTKGNGDSVVGVTAENAHEEHENVPSAEGLFPRTLVLHKEERYDALRTEFKHGHFVAQEERVGSGEKKENEKSSEDDFRRRSVGSQQLGGEIDEQREERCRGCDDERRVPHAVCRHGDNNHEEDGEQIENEVGEAFFHVECEWTFS